MDITGIVLVQYHFHYALGKSPFEMLYGRKPHHFGMNVGENPGNTDLAQWLQERAAMIPVMKHHLERAI